MLGKALTLLQNYTDPEGPVQPSGATPIEVESSDDPAVNYGCWQTFDGTHYGELSSMPWQAKGSATLVECDGTGAAHGQR